MSTGRPPTSGTDDYLRASMKFKGRLLSEMEPILEHPFCETRCDKCKEKFQLILKMGPYALPRELQVGGSNGEPIRIEIAGEVADKNKLHETPPNSKLSS